MKVAVVGGGLMGLTIARRIAQSGSVVTVLEGGDQLGGLSTHHQYGSFTWDRFYHCVLPTDRHLIALLKDLGLGEGLQWRRTKTGFYVDGRFYSLSNSWEFLRFPPVSLVGKLRMAMTIMGCARIRNWRRLERISVADWLRRWSGNSTFERIWKPLLLAKLGSNYERVSAVFIWSYIKRMYGARDTTAGREMLGYIGGCYKTVFDRLRAEIEAHGGRIDTSTFVTGVSSGQSGGLVVATDDQSREFDKVVFTGPVGLLRKVVDRELLDYQAGSGDVEYLGVACGVVISRRPLMPYFALNIADQTIPFTGVIGMSNLVDACETAGRHITYLPRYLESQDELLRAPEAELEELFRSGLERLFGDLSGFGIEHIYVNRALRVQPLQVIDYSQKVPGIRTRHPDFYVVNTAQFVSNSLNNNEVVRLGEEFLAEHGDAFHPFEGTGDCSEFVIAEAVAANQ